MQSTPIQSNDRVIWRNKNNRLRHGIVERVEDGVLAVLESFAIPALANTVVRSKKKTLEEDADGLTRIPLSSIVRVQNLNGRKNL